VSWGLVPCVERREGTVGDGLPRRLGVGRVAAPVLDELGEDVEVPAVALGPP
jgi:hypothetical protein